MLVPRRWWGGESSRRSSSVCRSGCVVKDVRGAAVTPRRRAASEAASVPRRANMTPRRADSGGPLRRPSWRRPVVTSRGRVTLANPPPVYVSGSSQPHERCFGSVDTQCLTEGPSGHLSRVDTCLCALPSAPIAASRSTSSHSAHYSWLRRAWLAALVVVAAVGVLVTPAAANTPPRFVLDGQSEIVIRLTEGEATPVGEYTYAGIRRLFQHTNTS